MRKQFNTKLFIVQSDNVEIVAENFCIDILKDKAREKWIDSQGFAWSFIIVDYDNKKWYKKQFIYHCMTKWERQFMIDSDLAKMLGINWTKNMKEYFEGSKK